MSKKSKIVSSTSLFQRLEHWIQTKEKVLFIVISTCSILFSLLLFNAKITETNDDALYIDAGYKYAKDYFNYFYTANAPLYPMFLGILIKLVGLKLVALKIFSVLFHFLGIVVLYKALRSRVPYLLLFFILLFTAINYLFQYFASQTYTEAFYFFLQAVFLHAFVKLDDAIVRTGGKLKDTFMNWLLLAFVMLLMSLTKSVALVAIPAVIIVFVFRKQFLNAVYTVGAFLIVKIPFEIIKKIVWNPRGQFDTQMTILSQKDPYDPSKGKEDLIGFVHRFLDNCDLYLSKRFFQILGFMSESSVVTSTGLTVLLVLFLCWGLFQIIRTKNNVLLLTTFYSGFMLGASFIMLQTRWDQPRIVMVFVPFILLIIFYGLYISLSKTSSFSQWFLVLPILIILSSGFISSSWRAKKNLPIVKENLKGNILYGYTPDWINYFKMSEWCGENLPDTAMVACRKQPMSFVYGKKQIFYPVYTASNVNRDSILTRFKRDKVTHVLIASLRMNPAKADGNIINTLHRVAQPISDKLKLVHQIPAPDQPQLEPAYLYEIIY